jgi:hypothetical protein
MKLYYSMFCRNGQFYTSFFFFFYLEMSNTQIIYLSNVLHLRKSHKNRYIYNETVCSSPCMNANRDHKKYQDDKLPKILSGYKIK